MNVAGLGPVVQAGVENLDLSHIVKKHIDYCRNMKEILEHVDLLSPSNPF